MAKKPDNTILSTLSLAVAAFLIGLFLGVLFMTTIPAKDFKNHEALQVYLDRAGAFESPMPTERYYFLGPDQVGNQWVEKRAALLEGDPESIVLSAGDLNGWIRKNFQWSKAPRDDNKIVMSPALPDFYIRDGELYLSTALEVVYFGKKKNYRLITRGTFDNSGSKPRFVPEMFYINNARVPFAGMLATRPGKLIDASYGANGEYQAMVAAFESAKSIDVKDDALHIQFR